VAALDHTARRDAHLENVVQRVQRRPQHAGPRQRRQELRATRLGVERHRVEAHGVERGLAHGVERAVVATLAGSLHALVQRVVLRLLQRARDLMVVRLHVLHQPVGDKHER
jgi:hypothetical protein